jgi:hypothetical protein
VALRPSTCCTTHVKGLGHGVGLAVVERLDRGEDVEVALHELGDLDEVLAPLKAGAVGAPGGVEGLVRGVDGHLDVGGETLGDGGDGLAGGRVDDAAASERAQRAERWSEAGDGEERGEWIERVGASESEQSSKSSGGHTVSTSPIPVRSAPTHSIVLALLSLEVLHSLLMKRPVGISTLPLSPAWLKLWV